MSAKRRNFRDSSNFGQFHYGNIAQTRVDLRDQSDPLVQAGARNIHRNGAGKVIGFVEPDGTLHGTRERPGGKNWSETRGPAAATDPIQTTSAFRRVSGVVGTGASSPAAPVLNPAQQQAARMKFYEGQRVARGGAPAATTTTQGTKVPVVPGSTPVVPPAEADQIDVTGAPKSVVVPGAPRVEPPVLTPQVATNTPGAIPQNSGGQQYNRLTGKPMGWLPSDDQIAKNLTQKPAVASSPMKTPSVVVSPATSAQTTGKDLAEKTISKMGVGGATADYFRRNAEASAAATAKPPSTLAVPPTVSPSDALKQTSAVASAAKVNPNTTPNSAVADSAPSWRKTAGIVPPDSLSKPAEKAADSPVSSFRNAPPPRAIVSLNNAANASANSTPNSPVPVQPSTLSKAAEMVPADSLAPKSSSAAPGIDPTEIARIKAEEEAKRRAARATAAAGTPQAMNP